MSVSRLSLAAGCVGVALVAALVSAQLGFLSTEPANTLTVSPSVVDLGLQRPGAVAKGTVALVNESNGQIIVRDVVRTCTCTTIGQQFPIILEAGQQMPLLIETRISNTQRAGRLTQSIGLLYGSPLSKQEYLRLVVPITCRVDAPKPAEVVPGRIDFGTFGDWERRPMTFDIRWPTARLDSDQWRILYDERVIGIREIIRDERTVSVHVTPQSLPKPGMIRTTIQVVVLSRTYPVEVAGWYRGASPYFEPNTVVFQASDAQGASRQVLLRYDPRAGAPSLNLNYPGPLMAKSVEQIAGGIQRIVVESTPSMPETPTRGVVDLAGDSAFPIELTYVTRDDFAARGENR